MNIGDPDVEEPRPASYGYDVQSDRAKAARIEIYVHVLAGVVATDGWYDRVARLAADYEAIILANARPWSIQIELEKIQTNLANIRLPGHRYRASSRFRERRRRTRISEVGSIESDCLAAAHLDCINFETVQGWSLTNGQRELFGQL